MEIKIWLGNLKRYNEGALIGRWLHLPMDEEQLDCEIEKILPYREYELDGEKFTEQDEYFIADWECDIDGIVSEYASPWVINDLAARLDELSDGELELLHVLLASGLAANISDAIDHIDSISATGCSSWTELAEQLVDDGCFGEIPAHLANYIDYQAMGRDLRHDGCYVEHDGQIYMSHI